MTAIENEPTVRVSVALEMKARLVAAARGENLEAHVVAILRDYIKGRAA